MCCVSLAPSFDSQTVLEQISSDASTNTITVSIPQIVESSGTIRYVAMAILFQFLCNNLYIYAINDTVITTL